MKMVRPTFIRNSALLPHKLHVVISCTLYIICLPAVIQLWTETSEQLTGNLLLGCAKIALILVSFTTSFNPKVYSRQRSVSFADSDHNYQLNETYTGAPSIAGIVTGTSDLIQHNQLVFLS